uniref:Uncharacterized protein n=1 Tax=Glycine max TaxID=3847 RepID=C6TII1_SOYBN|nr:unknown [Glycine max]
MDQGQIHRCTMHTGMQYPSIHMEVYPQQGLDRWTWHPPILFHKLV